MDIYGSGPRWAVGRPLALSVGTEGVAGRAMLEEWVAYNGPRPLAPGHEGFERAEPWVHLVNEVRGVAEPQRTSVVQPDQVLQQHPADHLVRHEQWRPRPGTGDPGERPAGTKIGVGIALTPRKAVGVLVPRPSLLMPLPGRRCLGMGCRCSQQA